MLPRLQCVYVIAYLIGNCDALSVRLIKHTTSFKILILSCRPCDTCVQWTISCIQLRQPSRGGLPLRSFIGTPVIRRVPSKLTFTDRPDTRAMLFDRTLIGADTCYRFSPSPTAIVLGPKLHRSLPVENDTYGLRHQTLFVYSDVNCLDDYFWCDWHICA